LSLYHLLSLRALLLFVSLSESLLPTILCAPSLGYQQKRRKGTVTEAGDAVSF
jgi:hypothetical protein